MSEEKKEQAVGLVSGEPVQVRKRRSQRAIATEPPIRTGEVSKSGSQLFTVRMWPEPMDDGQVEWRGKVDHVASGEGYAFRDWSRLTACIEKMLHGGWRTGFGVG